MQERSLNRVDPDSLPGLLAAAKRGSAEAIGRLLDDHQSYLLLIANDELACNGHAGVTPSDVVQWTHLEACRDFHAFQGSSPGEFRAWLRRILLNNVADHDRRNFRATIPLYGDVTGDDPSPSSQVAANELGYRLFGFIQRLPHDERRVVEMRYFEGKSYADIGAVIGRTAEATRKLWARSIARLQYLSRGMK